MDDGFLKLIGAIVMILFVLFQKAGKKKVQNEPPADPAETSEAYEDVAENPAPVYPMQRTPELVLPPQRSAEFAPPIWPAESTDRREMSPSDSRTTAGARPDIGGQPVAPDPFRELLKQLDRAAEKPSETSVRGYKSLENSHKESADSTDDPWDFSGAMERHTLAAEEFAPTSLTPMKSARLASEIAQDDLSSSTEEEEGFLGDLTKMETQTLGDSVSLTADFDPRKAIIYAEIMKPKFNKE